jgi:hypothetical protein
MSEAARTVSRAVVILSSAVWRSELEAELVRLGVDAERAPRAAAKCLGRIVRHAGYRTRFLVGDEDESPQDEVPVSDRPGEWTASPR